MVGGVRALRPYFIVETLGDTYTMVIALLLISILVRREPQTVLVLHLLLVIAATGFFAQPFRIQLGKCSSRYAKSSPRRDDLLHIRHPAYLANIAALVRLYC